MCCRFAPLRVSQAASTGGPPGLSGPQASAVGWGGAPIQHQVTAPQQQAGSRFRHDDFAGGLGRGGRGPSAGPRGRGPQHAGPQQHHARHHQGSGRQHGDPRQKNHGYRRLWQQVTQVRVAVWVTGSWLGTLGRANPVLQQEQGRAWVTCWTPG